MADDERHDDRSLELPSLRSAFRRRRRGRSPEQEEPAEPASAETASAEGAAVPVATEPAPIESTGSSYDDSASPLLTEAGTTDGEAPRTGRDLRAHLPGPVAAAFTGAVVGLVLVGLTAGSLRLCTSIRGTSSCGKPGILLLLAIAAIAILLGALLLRVAGVAAPGSTSFLGVGLLVVVVLLALLGVLDEWWVVIVVPSLAVVTHLAAWWLTTTYADPAR